MTNAIPVHTPIIQNEFVGEYMWQYAGKHFEKADHQMLIRKILATIKEKQISVSMASGGYNNNKILLADVNRTSIQFHKPLDFPEDINSLKIMFKDICNMYYIFDVMVLSSSYGTLYTSIPSEILRMQRRAEARVATPEVSKVILKTPGNKKICAALENLSVNGMLISLHEEAEELSAQEIINKIAILMPSGGLKTSTWGGVKIHFPVVPTGKIAHKRKDLKTNSKLYGISFGDHRKAQKMIKEYINSEVNR